MTETPLVTIITVALNSENTIEKTLQSVLHQSYGHLEYIIIDGASTDKTLEIVRKYDEPFAKRGISFVVVSGKDEGMYDAMNHGIAIAKGELIGIINSDDWYEENAVETAVNAYKRTEFDYYCADINVISKRGRMFVKHSKLSRNVTSRYWNHPGCFVKANLYKELGAFRKLGLHDDFEFYLRVRKNQKNVVVENKVIANFTTGGRTYKNLPGAFVHNCKSKYACYRINGYSRVYLLECIATELSKAIPNWL